MMLLLVEVDGIISTLFRVIYRRRKVQPLESRKPFIKWLPKYRTEVQVPEPVASSDDSTLALEGILEELGFELAHWTRETVVFRRGKSWGDFSVRLIPLHVSFSLPLRGTCFMDVEVATVCLFDSGDLWKLTHELRELVEGAKAELEDAAAPAPPRQSDPPPGCTPPG
jgi:hypothetical protein